MSSKNKVVKLRSLDDQSSSTISEKNKKTVHSPALIQALQFRVLGQYIADYIPVAVDLAIAAARSMESQRPSPESRHGTVVIGDYHFGWEMARHATAALAEAPGILLITIPNMREPSASL